MSAGSPERPSLVRIGRQSFLRRMAVSAGSSGALGGVIAGGSVPSVVRILLPSVGLLVEIGLALGYVVVAAVVGLAIAALLVPRLPGVLRRAQRSSRAARSAC